MAKIEQTAQPAWHKISFAKTAQALETDIERGLSKEEVEIRRKKYGLNALPEEKIASRLHIFINQFKSPLIYILIIAGIVTLALGKWTDSLVIFGAVLINAIFGSWEENKTSRILEKLKKILKARAIVLRDGHKIEILSSAGIGPW